MKRIVTIVALLAMLLSCLTSCGSESKISSSKVGEYWNALLGGEHKVENMDLYLRKDTLYPEIKAHKDAESIDEFITFLKNVESQIKKEIDDPSEKYQGLYNYHDVGVVLYMNTGDENAYKVSAYDEKNELYDLEFHYIIEIVFTHNECHIYITDGLSAFTGDRLEPIASAYFECEKPTSDHCEALKAIFE